MIDFAGSVGGKPINHRGNEQVNKQELNKGLAEWAGFTCHWEDGATDALWNYPNGVVMENIPDFTQSLDACLKWFTPKLCNLRFSPTLYNTTGGWLVYIKGKDDVVYKGLSSSPAFAFCLAIEKLIKRKILRSS